MPLPVSTAESQASSTTNAGFNGWPTTDHTMVQPSSTRNRGPKRPIGQPNYFPEAEDDESVFSSAADPSSETLQQTSEKKDAQSSAQQDLPTVLLVDDNDINLRILMTFMTKLQCTYLTAQNGQDALDVFKRSNSQIGIVFMGRSSCII